MLHTSLGSWSVESYAINLGALALAKEQLQKLVNLSKDILTLAKYSSMTI